MDIIESIKNNFNKGFFGKGMLIPGLPDFFPAWTFKQNNWVAVAVPTGTYIPFSETFAQVKISTFERVVIGDAEYNILMLQCFAMDSRNEFAAMCKQFVEPGLDGKLRQDIISDPSKWWKNWKDMLGNVSSDRTPYDILGELLVLEQQVLAGKHPVWAGVDHATNDVEMDDASIEVKSSIQRYGYEVTISSLYQLRPLEGKTLSLAFLRFEKSALGRSINDVVTSLKVQGYDVVSLERALTKLGLEEGRVARNQKYKILEWKLYNVDDAFPTVTESSFKHDKLPPNIVRFTYTLDLAGISGQSQI